VCKLTHGHSGVLLFVSMAERYVEIVADKGIHEKIGEARWQGHRAAFLQKVQAGGRDRRFGGRHQWLRRGHVRALSCAAWGQREYFHGLIEID